MKRNIALILALVILLTGVFTACKKKDEETNNKETVTAETAGGLPDSDTEIDFVEVDVTDKNGETVTEKDGSAKKEEVPVIIKKDKNGKRVGYRIDNEGNPTGEPIDLPDDDSKNTNKKDKKDKSDKKDESDKKQDEKKDKEKETPKEDTLAPTDPNDYYDSSKGGSVPTTSATGKEVEFSSADQQRIIKMLEVPYLYKASYENSQGVPIVIATHAALWMAEKDGLQPATFASGTIVLGLFKYFGQTVVNFKGKCNEAGNENITYNSSNETFLVNDFESKQQEVKLQKIEQLGNGYYKVTASVTNAEGKSKVVAILQKNKLDLSLGFSIKALKWS